MVASVYLDMLRRSAQLLTAFDPDAGEVLAWANLFYVRPNGSSKQTQLTVEYRNQPMVPRMAYAGDPKLQGESVVPPRYFGGPVPPSLSWCNYAANVLEPFTDWWSTKDVAVYVAHVNLPKYPDIHDPDECVMYLFETLVKNYIENSNLPEF